MIDEFDVSDHFTYEYNFFEHWIHDIRVETIYENSTLKTPFCINGHGMPRATAADEFDKALAFLEAIVNADDETTLEIVCIRIYYLYFYIFQFVQLCFLWGLRKSTPDLNHHP